MKRTAVVVILGILFCFWVYSVLADWELKFYGAVGGEVAGSCYLLTNGTDSILIDCGSHMSEEIELEGQKQEISDYSPFDFSGETVKAIIITHAHADHIGRLPYFFLYNPDYKGPVFMTYATAELYFATLNTTINYMKGVDGKELDSTTKETIKRRLKEQIDPVHFMVAFSPVQGVSAYFINTGHIPGSSAVVLNLVEGEGVTTVTFSGDLGPGDHPFLPPMPLDSFSHTQTNILVIESTYGDVVRSKEEKAKELEDFYQALTEYCGQKLVIIPTFALDRTQRILATLVEGIRQGRLPAGLKIAVGGKSSQEYTEAYTNMMATEDLCSRYFSSTFCTSKPLDKTYFEYKRFFEEDYDLARNYHIIVTPSGTGASSDAATLLRYYLPNENVLVMKVGWAPLDSPMGQLAQGRQTVSIGGVPVPVKADFRSYHSLFSGHADQQMLVEFVQAFPNLRAVVVTHGSEAARDALEKALRAANANLQIVRPQYRQVLNLKSLTITESHGAQASASRASTLCIPASEARHYVGAEAWVYGIVASVRRLSYGRVFLNFEKPRPFQSFTVMIEEEYIYNFDSKFGFGWENALLNRYVCVEGVIELYNNIPEIKVYNPLQLKVIPTPITKSCPCQ
ncbi:MAG: MBL fold metallo-hydrolase [Candidatus Bipolaricaulaceae bacterium]